MDLSAVSNSTLEPDSAAVIPDDEDSTDDGTSDRDNQEHDVDEETRSFVDEHS